MMWYFWLIPVVVFWSFGFRRRWEPHRRPGRKKRRESEELAAPPELAAEVEAQRSYIGDLEARVAELENRLDFTERLLSSRHHSESTA
jgi:hypothetical protein